MTVIQRLRGGVGAATRTVAWRGRRRSITAQQSRVIIKLPLVVIQRFPKGPRERVADTLCNRLSVLVVQFGGSLVRRSHGSSKLRRDLVAIVALPDESYAMHDVKRLAGCARTMAQSIGP